MEGVAEEVTLHGIGPAIRGRSSVSFVVTSVRAAFPDLHLDSGILACDGASAIVRFTATGTQQTPLFGLPVGEARDITGVACLSVSDRGITDLSLYVDGGRLVEYLDRRSAPSASVDTAGHVQAGSWVDRLAVGAREIWLAGVGALGAAGAESERLFHELVEHGRAVESSGREREADTAETMELRRRTLAERARRIAASGGEYVRDVASGVQARLAAPTREEFDELSRKVDRLLARFEPPTGSADTDHSAGESTSS
jgi:poly(hydroxyalkanoate) granule-associated protein